MLRRLDHGRSARALPAGAVTAVLCGPRLDCGSIEDGGAGRSEGDFNREAENDSDGDAGRDGRKFRTTLAQDARSEATPGLDIPLFAS